MHFKGTNEEHARLWAWLYVHDEDELANLLRKQITALLCFFISILDRNISRHRNAIANITCNFT